MSQDRWTEIDRYIDGELIPGDPALEAALRDSEAAGLPSISVTPSQGKLLHILALSVGARRILEVGTLGGYSAIWLARALPADGKLITLELEPRHADVARKNFARAKLVDRIEVRVGPALESLPRLAAEGGGPFDLAFIDADKPSNADYFAWAMKLSRPGTIIVVDNVIRGGTVLDAKSRDANVRGARRLFEALAAETRVTATAIQTVGAKGHDGLAIAIVKG